MQWRNSWVRPRSPCTDDSELDQRHWWPGLEKEDTARPILGRLSSWLFAWCRSVQELISLEEQRGFTEPCCSRAGGACESCFKGFCPDSFEECFSGCSFRGCQREAETWCLCEELSLILLVGLISLPVHCFWLSQNAWELCPSFFLLPVHLSLAFSFQLP